MNSPVALQILKEVGAIITDSHIVYTSGKHGTSYINKDAIYPHTTRIMFLAGNIAEHFKSNRPDVVIAPAIGGVILSQWVAHCLLAITGFETLSVYAEKSPDGESFIISRGYDGIVCGKNVLVVEDVLTTGGSAKKVIEATRGAGGNVVGLGAICNRGGVTTKDLSDIPRLSSLVDIKLDSWDELECPLCAQNVPINTDVGKGREYLARKKS